MYVGMGASPNSELGQAVRLIESMYWESVIWFIMSMILLAFVVILLGVTGFLGYSLQTRNSNSNGGERVSSSKEITSRHPPEDIEAMSPKFKEYSI